MIILAIKLIGTYVYDDLESEIGMSPLHAGCHGHILLLTFEYDIV